MTKYKRLIIGLVILGITTSLFFKDFRIGFKDWKYQEGHYLGDFIKFDYHFSLTSNDTLYKLGIPIALLGEYNFRLFDDKIIITSLNKQEKGIYFSK